MLELIFVNTQYKNVQEERITTKVVTGGQRYI